MLGGGLGNIAPGQWSDDTEMACAIAGVAATGADMRTAAALDAIAGKFLDWYAEGPPDVGMQTRHVLACTGPRTPDIDVTGCTGWPARSRTRPRPPPPPPPAGVVGGLPPPARAEAPDEAHRRGGGPNPGTGRRWADADRDRRRGQGEHRNGAGRAGSAIGQRWPVGAPGPGRCRRGCRCCRRPSRAPASGRWPGPHRAADRGAGGVHRGGAPVSYTHL